MSFPSQKRTTIILCILILIAIACNFASPPIDETSRRETAEAIFTSAAKTAQYLDITATPTFVPATPALPGTSTPDPLSFQQTDNPNTSSSKIVGELNLEYPYEMLAGGSEVVYLSIDIPAELLNSSLISFVRVTISENQPEKVPVLQLHKTNILISKSMRAELTSQSFEIKNLMPNIQNVDTQVPDNPTTWAWDIKSPDTYGSHILSLRIYLNEDQVPIWTGVFKVNVVGPTATPTGSPSPTQSPSSTPTMTPTIVPTFTFTPTATPTIGERIVEGMVNNPTAVLAIILPFIIGIITIYFQYIRPKRQEKSKKNK